MSVITPYLTVTEANTLLGTLEPWASEDDDTVKENALVTAKLYFDQFYKCANLDEDDPSDIIKEANALLANAQLTSSIFDRQSTTGPLEEQEVRAGSVLSRKRYSARGKSNWVDPFPYITSLALQDQCKIQPGAGAVQFTTVIR